MSINGTIILCDNVYEAAQGKFIIAGTYNSLACKGSRLQLPSLECYLRLYPEKIGKLPVQIRMVDAERIDAPPLFTANLDIDVTEHQIPILEFAFKSRIPLSINCNFQNPEDTTANIPFSVQVLADDELIASTPLRIRFENVKSTDS